MGLKWDVTLLFVGALLRLLDFVTDILYITTQDFAEDIYFSLSIVSIVTPPFIILILYIVAGACIIRSDDEKNVQHGIKFMGIGVILSILDPTGIPIMIFACIMATSKAEATDRAYIELITKLTGLVEGLIESAPQAVI